MLVIFLSGTVSPANFVLEATSMQNPLWKRSHWLVSTQLLFFPIVISIGVLYPADGPSYLRSTPNSTANHVCDFLGWLHWHWRLFWVYRMKGFRWFAVSVVTVLEMILMGAFFVAGMAITGDWL